VLKLAVGVEKRDSDIQNYPLDIGRNGGFNGPWVLKRGKAGYEKKPLCLGHGGEKKTCHGAFPVEYSARRYLKKR